MVLLRRVIKSSLKEEIIFDDWESHNLRNNTNLYTADFKTEGKEKWSAILPLPQKPKDRNCNNIVAAGRDT